ncbi:MAG: 6-bladed beta-propeller [Thermodesulfobacteriota bacterium]
MATLNGKKYSAVILLTLAALLCFISPVAGEEQVKESYLYSLSDFSGLLPYNWPTLAIDEERHETFVIYQNEVVIFNDTGMEVYRFGDGMDLGHVLGADAGQGDDILLLTYKAGRSVVLRCDYRGQPIEEISIKGLPAQFSQFTPNRIIYKDGQIYLASQNQMQIVICAGDGSFVKGFDLFEVLSLEEDKRGSIEFAGFSLDKGGNILFTIPVLFKANILAMDGMIRSFGKSGGAPGRFNILAGMVADSHGNYLVADKLKCAIIVFDKDLNFIKEFGYRGPKPGNMIVPSDLAIDKKDRIYVSQGRRRGVSVFRLDYGDSTAHGESLGKLSQNKGGMNSG